jgi:cyclic-di-AMP phosphodiesterase PgpH
MIKPAIRNKIFFGLGAIFAFAFSYFIQFSLVVTLFLVLLCFYAKKSKNIRHYKLIQIILLFLIVFTASSYTVRENIPFTYLLYTLAPMLATMLFGNLEISFLLVVGCAVSVASISKTPLQVSMLFLVNGLIASYLVHGARRRSTVIRAGIIVGISQVVSIVLIERFAIGPSPEKYAILLMNGFLTCIIVLGVLPIFEYLFRTLTNISLLELADFNHPLLQRMVMEAPGTYHHSLIVGNISEAACRAIGANALLARVGAYYHDIGKMVKPGYFSENQSDDLSKHDNLSPSISKMIIMNHIKEGVDLAQKYRLSPILISFIQQHHGSSLVYYFYRRALEKLEEEQEVEEEGFRYPGPKPNTKETAIVLLADSVEAATRALRDHSPKKVEEAVHKIINNKFIDRQLDECDLTLNDLEKISEVFIRFLSGIYHSRAEYPEETRSENNHKKPAKENHHPSDKDKKNGS